MFGQWMGDNRIDLKLKERAEDKMTDKEAIEIYKDLKRYKQIIGNIDTDFFFEFAETVLNLLEKKNKIINEMAKFIEVFELDEEIVKTYCDGTAVNCRHKEDIATCKSCIKEYFERKSENGTENSNC